MDRLPRARIAQRDRRAANVLMDSDGEPWIVDSRVRPVVTRTLDGSNTPAS